MPTLAHRAGAATIQLFVTALPDGAGAARVANIETDSGWAQWKWMANYRVWEANRKIFLWPENWIEPELRDDKSVIFQDLENDAAAERADRPRRRDARHRLPGAARRLGAPGRDALLLRGGQSARCTSFARTKGGDPATLLLPPVPAGALLDAVGEGGPGHHRRPPAGLRPQQPAAPCMADLHEEAATRTPLLPFPPFPPVGGNRVDTTNRTQAGRSSWPSASWPTRSGSPRRISRDATPHAGLSHRRTRSSSTCTTCLYLTGPDMVLLLTTNGQDSVQLRGVFDFAGCKGYPEPPAGQQLLPPTSSRISRTRCCPRSAIAKPTTSPATSLRSARRCPRSHSTTS